jgi:predicted RNA-binding Zn ribbon-like protein
MQQSPAIFVADVTGLDFLNSVATPVDVRLDWLEDGAGLLNWLEQAGLVPPAILERFRAQYEPPELNTVAAEARELREWFRVFVQKHRGRPLARDQLKKLEPLSRLLERDSLFGQITPVGKGAGAFELRLTRRWHSPESLLAPIAEALARLVCSEDFSDVKACQGAACTLLFADRTRGGARRWCSMAICGNRAKQAAHRARARVRG